MQGDQQNAKQLIVERIKQATNVLVTVENNPSVDELAAALALTLMLNKMDKHGTAVFSGAVPPAISFLEPTKTFEDTVDSLRDFIIALDKEKADRLRYKVEDDVVKIFITPYRSTITDKDLQFSQGDFNVEVIVALGVEKREDLDKAIVAHGRILHDATVITVNARNDHSSLGAIDWQDGNASSICEMLVSISEAFQLPGLLDQQIATALLTGIVAATNRFSNEHTSPRVMTMAAQLMAAGANQQLIANNLAQQLKEKATATPANAEASKKIDKNGQKKDNDGEMRVAHEDEKTTAGQNPPSSPTVATGATTSGPTIADEVANLKAAIEAEGNQNPPMPVTPQAPPAPAPRPQSTLPEPKTVVKRQRLPDITSPGSTVTQDFEGGEDTGLGNRASWQGKRLEPPSLGGTLNATTAEAEEDKRRSEEQDRNRTILSHRNTANGSNNTMPSPLAAPAPSLASSPAPAPMPMPSQFPSTPFAPPSQPPLQQNPAPTTSPAPSISAASTEQQNAQRKEQDVEEARKAVDAALASGPLPNEPLQSIGSQPMPEAPVRPSVDQTATTTPPAAPMPVAQSPAAVAPPAPTSSAGDMPPLPDFNTLPPLPPMPPLPTSEPAQAPMPTTQPAVPPANSQPNTAQSLPPSPPPPAPPAPGQVINDPNDPNQFKIPGQ